MKVLHKEINVCGDCPAYFYDTDNQDYRCNLTNPEDNFKRDISWSNETYPSWCPLPDIKEGGKE
jgi:hypothetical protein